MKTKEEEKKLATIYNDYFRVKYENSKWYILGRLIEYESKNNEVLLKCKNGSIIIKIITSQIINVKTLIENKINIDSFVVNYNIIKNENYKIIENDFLLKIKTSDIIIEIIKDPVRIIFKNIDGNIINSDSKTGISFNNEFIKCEKILQDGELFYGFGDKIGPLQKRGEKMCMWNTDFPYFDIDSDPLYKSIPFFIGLKNGTAYGIFMDCPSWSIFDMGYSNKEVFSFGCYSLNMDYYFIYGHDVKDVIKNYTYITGRIELPPKWSLGYQQCRWSYDTEEKVKEIANTFRAKQIPCDVIYLDIDYMDKFKIFTYDKNKFPNLKKLCEYLSQKGFKLACIIDSGIKVEEGYDIYEEGVLKDFFIKKPSGKLFVANVWPGESVFPDFLNSKVRDWWASLQNRLLSEGVSGIWNDMNEPATFNTPGKTLSLDAQHNYNGIKINHSLVHNLYGFLENLATFEGFKRFKPNERPFILSRSIYAGGQKYAAVWTGDNASNEKHLKQSIPQCLNLGISGFAFSGMDIGGFHGNPSPELYTRWLQLGALFPLCRTHTVIDSNDQEPWSFGGGYEEINRRAIELRYRLLPYIYTIFYESSKTGLPVIRPLFLEYPFDQNTYEIQDEFLLGDKILIAPILEVGMKSRKVYFPEGLWYDYYTYKKISGGEFYEIKADINTIPIFIKGGAIISEQKVLQYVNEKNQDKIYLNIFPGENISNYLYEDDGITYEYNSGNYRLTYFSQIEKDDRIYINISKPEGKYNPVRVFQMNIFVNKSNLIQVKRDLEEIPLVSNEDEFSSMLNVAYFNNEKKILKIKFPDESKETMIIVYHN